jgi:hypothetical protein
MSGAGCDAAVRGFQAWTGQLRLRDGIGGLVPAENIDGKLQLYDGDALIGFVE